MGGQLGLAVNAALLGGLAASALLVGTGYGVVERQACGGVPFSRLLGGLGRSLDRLALTTLPGLFGWQFVFACRNDRHESRVMS